MFKSYDKYKLNDCVWNTKIPAEWNTTRIKNIIKTHQGGAWGNEPDGSENDRVCIRVADFVFKNLEISSEDYTIRNYTGIQIENLSLQCGDILIEKSGGGDLNPVGRAVVFNHSFPALFANFLERIRPNEKSNPFFLGYIFAAMYYNGVSRNYFTQTTGIQNLNVGKYMNEKIAMPSLDIQRAIASYLDRKTAQIDSIIAAKEKLIELLKEKRQAIISEAVTHGLDTSVPMKESGIDWIGQIPAHWEVKPLFIVASENRAKNDGNQCGNLLSLSYGKIINKDIETKIGLLPESFETYQIVQGGYTILRLTDLQNDKRSLRTGFVKETGIITSAYVGIIPTMELDGCFLSDLLHAYDIMKIFYSLGNGVRQSMNYKDLKRLPILVPPIAEQQKISTALLQETAKLDALVSEIESQIMALKEYRQSVISEAVTGKIMVAAPQPVEQPEQPEQPTAISSGANIHFKRRVLAAKILDRLCGENTLGHVKLEKLLFLSEYCAELDMHTEYIRHAAGPYSPKVLRSIDAQLQKAKWFAYDKNNRGSKYCRLDKSTEYAPYFDANFSAEQNITVEHLVELFRKVDTERCEIVATLYGAWNDFLIDGCTPTDEQIADEVLTHWSEEKKRIERDRWLKAIGWMRNHQIVPHGYGEKTKRRDI